MVFVKEFCIRFLSNLYVDDLICQLESQRKGCVVNNIFLGCIFYADDVLLFSASVAGLQQLLNVYVMIMVLSMTDIYFNSRKSNCVKFGKNIDCTTNGMLLHDVVTEWVDSFKYLGITFNL